MSSRRSLVQINPTNQGNNVYSFRGGTNTIIFDIPMTPAVLNGKSVSINGTFNTFTGVGDARPTNRSSPDGIIIPGQPGAGGATSQDVMIDPRTGVNSAIDFITIQSLEGTTYEQIKNYNRMCSSIINLQDGIKSYLNGGVNMTYGAVGKTQQQGRMCDTKINFSLDLLCGFMQSAPIDLQLCRGLRITLSLASDFLLHQIFLYAVITFGKMVLQMEELLIVVLITLLPMLICLTNLKSLMPQDNKQWSQINLVLGTIMPIVHFIK